MANTKLLFFYIFFLVIFGTMISLVNLSGSDKPFDITNFMKIGQLRSKLEANSNLFSSILSVVLIPFLLLDFIIALFVILGFGFTVLPAIINAVLFVPLGILITFDYIIPIIRGN